MNHSLKVMEHEPLIQGEGARTTRSYPRIVQDAHGAHLCSGLCAGSQRSPTIDSHSPPQPPISPMDGRDLLALPPRCSCHQVEACCMARIARATMRMDGTSALISANRSAPGVPKRACGTDAALGQSPEHSPGVRCRAVHVAVFGARQFHSSAMSHRM